MGSEKRLFPALLASFVFVFALQFLFPSDRSAEEGDAGAPGDGEVGAPSQADGGGDDDAPASGVEPWTEPMVLGEPGEHGYMQVTFSSLGGSVAEIRLGNYYDRAELTDEEKAQPEHWVRLVRPAVEFERTLHTLMTRAVPGTGAHALLELEPSSVHWAHEVLEDGVRFTLEDPSGVVLTKEIRAVAGADQLRVTHGVATTTAVHQDKQLDLRIVASAGMTAERDDSGYAEPRAVAAEPGGDPNQVNVDPKGGKEHGEQFRGGPLAYVGTHNKYFAAVLRPAGEPGPRVLSNAVRIFVYDKAYGLAQRAKDPQGRLPRDGFLDILAEASFVLAIPGVGETESHEYILYAGPKDKDHFTEGEKPLEDVLQEDLGFFDGIAALILGYLRFLHGVLGNWGFAIILMTLTVRLLLFPLQRKMQTSMARHATKMKRVQPKIEALKEKHKDDPKKLREEQARLFQQEGAMPPVGGCLPIFLQIPIFFGLFSALRVSFDLRQAPWIGWITDLSEPDHLFKTGLDTDLWILPDLSYFNLLPILMVVLWVGQQKVMPKPAAMSEQQEQMQKIMMWMPIMFGVFLYNYASGLSLYMITTSAFGILETTVIRKIWPIDDSEQPKKKSRFMAKLEQLQEQALQVQEQQRRQQQAQQRGGGGKRKKR